MKYLQILKIRYCAFLVTAFFTGCLSTGEDLTNTSPYSKYINQRYSINEDCYVYCYFDNPKVLLMGIHARCTDLPEEVDAKYIGRSEEKVKIMGIVPKSSVFKIVALYRNHTFESSYYDYKIKLEGAINEKWPLLDASPITNEVEKPPVIDSRFAKKLT